MGLWWGFGLSLTLLGVIALPAVAATAGTQKAPTRSRSTPQYIRPRVTCPSDLGTLAPAMLRDLPSYMNRQYIRVVARRVEGISYAIAASQPDFTPLPAASSEYANPVDKNLYQIFFTVLERQYFGTRVREFQHYHWLFLTKTIEGWQIALMFSRLGSYPHDQQPMTPPKDSSQSLTAQAIRLWLRDCQAGSVKL